MTAFRRPILITLLLAAGTASLWAGEAQARERSAVFTGAKGGTVQRHVSRQHGDVSTSTTGPNGKTSSRVVDRSPEGTSATVTGPNGGTATRETTRTVTPQP